MSSLRAVVALLGIGLALIGRGIWMETAISPPLPLMTYEPATAAVSGPNHEIEMSAEEQRELLRMDKYGNQIERAVVDYRIDPRGDRYERHAPDTDLPRLGPPGA